MVNGNVGVATTTAGIAGHPASVAIHLTMRRNARTTSGAGGAGPSTAGGSGGAAVGW